MNWELGFSHLQCHRIARENASMSRLVWVKFVVRASALILALKKATRSKFEAPLGRLTILSAWKVIDNGKNYLTTLKFIPPRPLNTRG